MWPFSKKHGELGLPAADAQRWSVASALADDDPLVVRFNNTAKEIAGHPALPIKLCFAVPLNRPNESGLPDPEENAELGAVEDLIAQRVLELAVGLHALTLTNGVMKEFVFYVAPGLDIAGLHAALRDEVKSHDVQCMADEERDWASFLDFVP